ncbi:MAG: D-aminoacyl-tRNA deacylase [Candidatus Peregrinibacteria bacterium]|nr:D-aminoacyl-tRNA deacylase [Candidatus Peregrinibacteria bacterium]
MRLLLQRVSRAEVTVDGAVIGSIGKGYLLFLCVMAGDTSAHAQLLAEKVTKLRLFPGEVGKVNDRSIADVGGSILVVSQFTLAGDVSKGSRPDYTKAAPPADAETLYEFFIEKVRASGIPVEAGQFGAAMEVTLVNDGPVTLWLEN